MFWPCAINVTCSLMSWLWKQLESFGVKKQSYYKNTFCMFIWQRCDKVIVLHDTISVKSWDFNHKSSPCSNLWLCHNIIFLTITTAELNVYYTGIAAKPGLAKENATQPKEKQAVWSGKAIIVKTNQAKSGRLGWQRRSRQIFVCFGLRCPVHKVHAKKYKMVEEIKKLKAILQGMRESLYTKATKKIWQRYSSREAWSCRRGR